MRDKLKTLERYGFQYKNLDKKIESLPIIYNRKYQFKYIKLMEHFDVLLVSKRREVSLDVFVNDSIYLSKRLSNKVVLIFDEIITEDVRRLIAGRISFISDNMFFIPFMGAVIENIEKPSVLRKPYTINQQRLLIHLLLNKDKEISPSSLVDELDISIASVYRILKYFSDLGYIESTHGSYVYLESRSYIYEDSINYFINPIEKSIPIPRNYVSHLQSNDFKLFVSGIDALSAYTMLASNKNVIGIEKKEMSSFIKENIEKNENLNVAYYIKENTEQGAPSSFYTQDSIILQVWKYKPTISSQGVIDFINLSILDIEDEEDPRIIEALRTLNAFVFKELEKLDRYER